MEKTSTGLLVAHHRRPDRGLRRLRRLRRGEGHPVAVQHQHGARPGARRLRLHRRPHHHRPRPAAHLGRRLPRRPAPARRPHRGDRRRGRRRLARQLDRLLLGLVDLLDALRRHVHRPHQPGPHHPPVRRRRHPRAQHRQPGLVRRLRRYGDEAAGAAASSAGESTPEGQLFGVLQEFPIATRHQPAGDDPRRHLLRLRRRRRLHRDGHALPARRPRTRPLGRRLLGRRHRRRRRDHAAHRQRPGRRPRRACRTSRSWSPRRSSS